MEGITAEHYHSTPPNSKNTLQPGKQKSQKKEKKITNHCTCTSEAFASVYAGR